MNSDPLDTLLRSFARQSLPSSSERLSADVWRAIRLRRPKPFWSRLLPILDWREVFGEPRLVVSALVVALAVGALPAILAGHAGTPRLVRESLHFDVFTASRLAFMDGLADQPVAAPAAFKP